jgi:hypothetical protein
VRDQQFVWWYRRIDPPSLSWCPLGGHTGPARLWLVSSLVTFKRGLEGPCTVPLAQALRVAEKVAKLRWGGGLHSTHLPIINSSVFSYVTPPCCVGAGQARRLVHTLALCAVRRGGTAPCLCWRRLFSVSLGRPVVKLSKHTVCRHLAPSNLAIKPCRRRRQGGGGCGGGEAWRR